MLEYKFYLIDLDGHIDGPGYAQVLADDRAAIKAAKQLVDGHDVEIWQGTRLVAYVVTDPDKTV